MGWKSVKKSHLNKVHCLTGLKVEAKCIQVKVEKGAHLMHLNVLKYGKVKKKYF